MTTPLYPLIDSDFQKSAFWLDCPKVGGLNEIGMGSCLSAVWPRDYTFQGGWQLIQEHVDNDEAVEKNRRC